MTEKQLSFERLARAGVVSACAAAPINNVEWLQVLPGVPLSTLFLAGAALLLIAHITATGRVYVPPVGRVIISLTILPFLLALTLGVPAALRSHPLGINYENYLEVASGRIANFVLLSIFLIGAFSIARHPNRRTDRRTLLRGMVRAYWIVAGIVIAIGLWQAGSFYFDVPYPFPDTRSHLHSVPAFMRNLVPGRLTSITAEPSYFAPLVIDFAILSVFFARGWRLLALVAVAGLTLMLSFSAGGYLNAAILAAVFVGTRTLAVAVRRRVRLTAVAAIVLMFAVVVFLFAGPLSPYVGLVTSRSGTALVPEAHGRAFMVLMPFYWLSDSTLVNMIFGHGPKSYALIGQVMTMPASGLPVYVTSNNLYSDLVWEHGVLGLIAVVALLTVLAFKGLATYLKTPESTVPVLLVAHLSASSLYRADFYSLRFFCILIIIALAVTASHVGQRCYAVRAGSGNRGRVDGERSPAQHPALETGD